ncbi:MAG: D-tyrosyl-tRNA(Tyr) deacylase [Lachnospiraceae bacterium]|nr:D-tyrosyl-tRNA(Tyr) deacylase [Lachnospiraceae bacterium]
MRVVIQRVKKAEVSVEGTVIGKVGLGYLVLLGVGEGDDEQTVRTYADKMLKLRIFADENGKTNKSLADVGGGLLIVSQFTLYADCRKGNRPSFVKAGTPERAKELYEYFTAYCTEQGYEAQTGEFGAHMEISLVNDGPFTIVLDESLAAGHTA